MIPGSPIEQETDALAGDLDVGVSEEPPTGEGTAELDVETNMDIQQKLENVGRKPKLGPSFSFSSKTAGFLLGYKTRIA
jgi:hypothetical protein